MIRIKLTSIAVDDQDKAERFYVEKLGFQVEQNIPVGPVRYQTLVSPADPDGVELSIEPGGQSPDFARFQARMVEQGIPWTAFAVDEIGADYARHDPRRRLAGSTDRHGSGSRLHAGRTCGNLIMLYSETAVADHFDRAPGTPA